MKMAEDNSEKKLLLQTYNGNDDNHGIGPSRSCNGDGDDGGDTEITSVLMFSIFIAVCTSFVGGTTYAYSAPVQSAIISDLDLSTADYSLFGSILTIGGLFGSIVCGKITDYMGRKATMLIVNVLYIVGWLEIAFSQGVWSLDLGRLILGFATSLGDYVVPVYIAEISPKNIRGGLVFMSQLMFFTGVASVLLVGLVTRWRVLALIAMLPCVIQLFGIFYIPESPRWLVNVGRDDDYEAALQWLRGKNVDISHEAADIRCLQDYIDCVENIEGDSFFNVFRMKYAYALTVGLGLMALSSFGGTTGILYYGTAIFESAGFSGTIGTMTMALIQLPPSALGVVLMDKFGRWPLLMYSAAGMCMACLSLALSFLLKEHGWLTYYSPYLAFIGITIFSHQTSSPSTILLIPQPKFILPHFPLKFKPSTFSLLHLIPPHHLGLRNWNSRYQFRCLSTINSNNNHNKERMEGISYLSQRDAAAIDETLMGPLGFSVDQLMELAGLSVACAVAEVYKPEEYNRVLAICGPGNNGGDGLVAARHLYHFGYKPTFCYPKRTPKPLYCGLVTQLESLSIPSVSAEDLPSDLSDDYDILIDAMFGFSFHGTPRPPFDTIIQRLITCQNYHLIGRKSSVIVSVDIPSGWHVEEGDSSGEGIKPDMLVSLTAPKLCAKKFSGPHHFLGGRFVPPAIADKYKLQLPPYPGTSMCVRVGRPPQVDISSLRENYISPALLEEQVELDPFDQFRKWFDDAIAAGLKEPNAMALSTASKNATPSSRMVLLKGVDKTGFVWFTNYGSQKAYEISENPQAALLFYWDGLIRQVRVEGSVEKVSEEESDLYFHSRPRGSQIGAIVSQQSSIVLGRQYLQDRYKELEERFSDGSVIPKPNYWGGFRLYPKVFEFWQGQPSRLHDRLRYSPVDVDGRQAWKIERLAP